MSRLKVALTLSLFVSGSTFAFSADAPPRVGDTAADFELRTVSGDKVKLSEVAEKGPVVLVVLRGFPGYQCPVCSQQVSQFLNKAKTFQESGVQVVLVYPGASQDLADRAKEFVKNKTIPEHFHLLIDPDYTFTNAYHLRWDAKNETAYPSTFVVDKDRKVTFAKVSKTHGDRAKVDDVLKALPGK